MFIQMSKSPQGIDCVLVIKSFGEYSGVKEMPRKKESFEDQTIDGMAKELARDTVKSMCKDGTLTPRWRSLAMLMDRIMP